MAQSPPPSAQNPLDLRDADFYSYVGRYCSEDILKYLKLLGVRSIHSLMEIDDIFSPLKEDYLELEEIKKKMTFSRSDGTCVIKMGIQHDVTKLLRSLQNTLFNNEKVINTLAVENDLILSSDFIRKYPFVKRLIDFLMSLSQHTDPTDEPFLHHFLENLLSNLPIAKSRYRYSELVTDFALCVSILAGRNGYEFLRINLPGALPNLTTIQTKLVKEGFNALEGEFRFDDMKKSMDRIDSKFAFCAEDCTSAVRKISYDAPSNSFVGFTLPLDENGMPRVKYFQTNSIEDLKRWFKRNDISHLINLHMIQPICIGNEKTAPFALSSYGTNGEYNYSDVLHRWFKIFEEGLRRGIRILGYSTDADSRYLSAMKLASGFFGVLSNSPAKGHPSLFKVDIPASWSWFFLPSEQLFLSMQDAPHICTKLRNRLLSSSAFVLMGDHTVTMDYLLNLIQLKSKFKHNLVKSDIFPSDKQNYRSCEKMCDSLECLKEIDGSYGTVVYLTIIRCIMLAFIDASTTTSDRIYHAWLATFLCRIWRTWLDFIPKQELYERLSQANNISETVKDKLKRKKTNNIFFITSQAYLCIELNAHHLVYLTLLVSEDQLPVETLKVFHFNSQTCESFFRLTRAITGSFSVSVNFSVQQFLDRQEKISVLNSIKSEANSSLTETKFKFPRHHKQRRNHEQSTILPEKLNKRHIQEQVDRAFQNAFKLLAPLGVEQVLRKSNVFTMNQISQHIHNHFRRSSTKADFLKPKTIDKVTVESDSDSDSDSEDVTTRKNKQNETNLFDYESEDKGEGEGIGAVYSSEDTTGSRSKNTKGLCDKINPDLKDSYFFVNIDGKKKYLHKSTATWYLADEKHKLSSDRLNRVMGT